MKTKKKSLSLAQMRREREHLRAEADQLRTRAQESGQLTGVDAERIDEILSRNQELKSAIEDIETRTRRVADLADMGNIEHATETGGPARKRYQDQQQALGLRGKSVLTRDDSISAWTRDNGHGDGEGASFDRYIRAILGGDWRGAPLERALAEGSLSAGGVTVPAPLAAQVLDLARNQAMVLKAGALIVPMTSQTLRLPRLVGEGTPSWRLENQPVPQADLAFDSVTLTARSLTRLVLVSRELLEDSDPSVGNVIANAFAAQIALELDRVALRGSGVAPEPRGLLNTTGVTIIDHGANGATPSWDWIIDAIGAVRNANYEPTGVIAAPRLATGLAKMKDTAGNYLVPPAGLPVIHLTKQIPVDLVTGTSTDTSEMFTGQWDQLAIGVRTSFTLEVVRERWIDNLQVGFLAHMRADVAVLQPSAFVIDRGVRA